MLNNGSFCPHWSWWARSGERLSLGLDLRRVLDGEGAGVAKRIQIGLDACLDGVEKGYGVVDSMRRAGVKLPGEAWCLLESGEHTGRLGEAMKEVGSFLKNSEQRKREFIGQMWYPVVVMLTGFLVMGIILLWVVPQMREISVSMGQGGRMPWLTEHIGNIYGGLFIGMTGMTVLISSGWILSGYMAGIRANWATGREVVAGYIPFFGVLRITRREARILRQVGTLLHGGVTLPAALDMAAARSPDQFEREQLVEFRKRLLMGISFEESLKAFPLVRKWNRASLVTGQESGRLDSYLQGIAADLDEEVSWKLKQAMRFLEPATIFGLAILIAGLVLAYLLPTIRMLEQLA